jgi:hypothetical protein
VMLHHGMQSVRITISCSFGLLPNQALEEEQHACKGCKQIF